MKTATLGRASATSDTVGNAGAPAAPAEVSAAQVLGHWQDFDRPVTISPGQAGKMYRAVLGIKNTLRLVADHQLRCNSGGVLKPRFSTIEIEAMLSGAIALAEMLDTSFEDMQFDGSSGAEG